MIYKARVIDTSMFPKTGKIRVRRFDTAHGENDTEDLSKFPKSISELSEPVMINGQPAIKHNDQEAFVYSPFGGGYDYGMFYLPQVNSVGLISDLGNTNDVSNLGNYVWLGAIYDYTPEKIGLSEKEGCQEPSNVNVPGLNNFDEDGISGGYCENDLLNSLVIKTKSTYLDDPLTPQDSVDTMNWKNRPIENLIVINDKKIEIIHNVINGEQGSVQNIKLNSDGINISNVINGVNSAFSIDSDGKFTIKRDDNTQGNTVRIENTSATGLEVVVDNGKKSTTIMQSEEEITLSSGDVTLSITDEFINLDAGNKSSSGEETVVNINAAQVRINGGSHPLAMVVGDVAVESGLQPASNIFA